MTGRQIKTNHGNMTGYVMIENGVPQDVRFSDVIVFTQIAFGKFK